MRASCSSSEKLFKWRNAISARSSAIFSALGFFFDMSLLKDYHFIEAP
jgi:hypothetical protein